MSEQSTRDPVIDLLDATQRETQELLTAVCQVHTDRIRDLMSRDLREQVLQILDDRFSQLELSLRPRMARDRLEVVRGITQVLNDCFSRMRRFESDRHWCEALLDAAGALSRRSAFFSVRAGKLCFQGWRGEETNPALPPPEIPCESALAFARAIGAGEPVFAARSAADLSAGVAGLFGDNPEVRVLLTPVTAESQAVGVIYAEEPVDASAIEAIAVMAGAVLEKHEHILEPVRAQAGNARPVTIIAPEPELPSPAAVDDPSAVRARRFAKVEVARMLLAHQDAIARGRTNGNLYAALREQMDAAWRDYRARFNGAPDYLHDEILNTLARNNASLLGRDYPGPLS
jgi:hypothetical protein